MRRRCNCGAKVNAGFWRVFAVDGELRYCPDCGTREEWGTQKGIKEAL